MDTSEEGIDYLDALPDELHDLIAQQLYKDERIPRSLANLSQTSRRYRDTSSRYLDHAKKWVLRLDYEKAFDLLHRSFPGSIEFKRFPRTYENVWAGRRRLSEDDPNRLTVDGIYRLTGDKTERAVRKLADSRSPDAFDFSYRVGDRWFAVGPAETPREYRITWLEPV